MPLDLSLFGWLEVLLLPEFSDPRNGEARGDTPHGDLHEGWSTEIAATGGFAIEAAFWTVNVDAECKKASTTPPTSRKARTKEKEAT